MRLYLRARLASGLFLALHGRAFKRLEWGARLAAPYTVNGASAIELGRHTVFRRGAWLYCIGIDGQPASMKMGKGCEFGFNNHIAAIREVVIGDNVLTANNVYISDNVHGYEDVSRPVMHQPVKFKNAVYIGDGCWIGENACIIGARVGRNCVVGANAVVTRDIPDFCVAVGAPARVIRRFDPERQAWIRAE